MPKLHLYSRPGCHLCEVMIEELVPLIRDRLELEVRNIDTDPEWQARFAGDIPVVEFDGEIICKHFLDREAITGILRR